MPDYHSDAGLLAHLQKQKANIGTYKGEIGATGTDIREINDDCAILEWLIGFAPQVDQYKTTATAVKRTTIRGKATDSIGDFAAAPSTTPPATLKAGIEVRCRERDARFKVATDLTQAGREGMELDTTSTAAPIGTVKPTITVHPAAEWL